MMVLADAATIAAPDIPRRIDILATVLALVCAGTFTARPSARGSH